MISAAPQYAAGSGVECSVRGTKGCVMCTHNIPYLEAIASLLSVYADSFDDNAANDSEYKQ